MQTLSQSPTEPEFVQDPYPFYARARAAGPVITWRDYGMVCATTHSAINAILRDRRFGRAPLSPPEAPAHLRAFHAVEDHSMLELEPPRHTRLRGLVVRAFTSRRIAGLSRDIAALTHALLDDTPRGPFDLLEVLARPLPVRIIARLLGVPETMAPELLAWSNAMVAMYQAGRSHGDEVAADRAAAAFADFLRDHVARRRRDPGDDLITSLIAAEQDGARLSTDELIATCILLLNAGHEATVHTLGNAVKALLDSGCRFDAGPEAVVEEALRFDPPLHLFTRQCYEAVEMFGHRFVRGDEVGLLLASAGRDEALHDRPDRFDPTRPRSDHLAFGAGVHFCVGAPLARLELQVALPIVFERMPCLRLAAEPRYAPIYHFHGLSGLDVDPGS